jgi:phosphoribosylformylglycinamidine cyclo-ligase
LARKIFFEQMRLKPTSWLPELNNTIGDELLKVHLSYGDIVQKLLKTFNSHRVTSSSNGSKSSKQHSIGAIKGLAHITGGGFVDNIPRVLPKNCAVVIRKDSWKMLPIFQILRARAEVPESELFQVFNMGIGMTIIVEAGRADEVLRFCRPKTRSVARQGVKRGRRGNRRLEITRRLLVPKPRKSSRCGHPR